MEKKSGTAITMYFLRDSKGLETDLVCRKDHQTLIPLEIKAGSTLSSKFKPGYVIYSGELTPQHACST